MLNAGVLSFDASDRVKALSVADYPAPYFNGGTPASLLQELVCAPVQAGYSAVAWINGLPYTSGGALVTDSVGAIVEHVGGVPLTAVGVAGSQDQAVAYWCQGMPFDTTGRIASTSFGAIINLSPFSTAFSEAFQ
jgi:hypothetical protein